MINDCKVPNFTKEDLEKMIYNYDKKYSKWIKQVAEQKELNKKYFYIMSSSMSLQFTEEERRFLKNYYELMIVSDSYFPKNWDLNSVMRVKK